MNYENILNCSANSNGLSVPFKLKRFVSASSQSQLETCSRSPTPPQIHRETGDNARNFYLRVCDSRVDNNQDCSSSSEDDVIICEVPMKKEKKLTHKTTQNMEYYINNRKTINNAMKFAQYDEVENLKSMIDEGVSVNITDNFGWSLLMVASYAGSENVVKYLISKGARRGKRDGKGNTALFLASKNNHECIVNLLIKNKKPSESEEQPANVDIINDLGTEVRNCEVCRMTPTCSAREHEASIAHLFRLGSSTTRPMYGIPRSNVGFQMLLQQGWNDTEGLGPEGSGRKYPIKATEKQDRLGLGHNSKENEPKRLKERKLESVDRKRTKHVEKQKEKYFRKMLNEPDILTDF